MENTLKRLLLTFLFFSTFFTFSQVRNCGTMDHLEYLKSQDPLLEERMEKNEKKLQGWIDNQSESLSSNIITIPVVVHVVYYNTVENISDQQIQSQIDILNQDFRRTNTDASNTPTAFQSVAVDCGIEFCLASIDPNGNPTNGITRTQTSQSSFSTNDGVKYSSSGGVDAWNTSQYLNIWVCDISGGILGYAQFPGGNASSDGIVCDYQYFGNIGTATAPFNLGRTTTHEVGHWLNLRHIWGDSYCGNDQCNDTPTQQSSNYGCPNFPSTSNCSGNGSNGDMFMNYMDYTDDACMNMFTQDQKTRMIAAINTYRSGLLTSNACQLSAFGCTDPSAFNYDPNAVTDDGSCCYISGCTDPSALNYSSNACFDDGSCTFPVYGCTDPNANNYDPLATNDDGTCCYGDILEITVTTDNYPTETSWQLIDDNGTIVQSISAGDLTNANTTYSWSFCPPVTSCYSFVINDTYGDGICCSYGNGSYSVTYNGTIVASGGSFTSSETTTSIGGCVPVVIGCMNPNANNYNPNANTSVAFGGIVDPNIGTGAYYNGNRHLILDANVPSTIVSADVYSYYSSNTVTFELRDNNSIVIDDTTITLNSGQQRLYFDFDVPVGTNYELGILGTNAGLYRNNAGVNYPYNIGGLVSITSSNAGANYYYFFYNIEVEAQCTGVIIPVYGCTDSTALNYDPLANTDDGSCVFPVYGCTDSTSFNYNPNANVDDGSCEPFLYGCTDPTAVNYYAAANTDDGSCIYPGCTDATATNYDPNANLDDGSCQYAATCGAITGIYVDNIIHDRAVFNWDDMNSSTCQVDQIRFRYREVGTSSYSTKTMGVPVGNGCNTINTSKLVLNLTPNTQYEYDFKIWYCNASTVNWHGGGTFTTAPECDNVINVTATPDNTTKTTFCWDTVSTYSFVRLQYRENVPGSSFSNIGGFGVFSPLTCKAKNGLTPGTQYRVMWRTWCSATGGPYRSPIWDGPIIWTQPSSIRIFVSNSESRELIKIVDVLGREVDPERVIENTTLFYMFSDGSVEKIIKTK